MPTSDIEEAEAKLRAEFPLYPPLAEGGAEDAQALVESFKIALTKAAEEAISALYTDLIPHIESDSWTNFRNDVIDGFKDYKNRKIHGEYDFKEIRQAMLRLHRDEIIEDLNQDMVKEIEDLKRQLESEREFARNRY